MCTPDKDLAQCVLDPRVVQVDRRKRRLIDEAAVHEKFGVAPGSIPDWLGLVGDSADGFPGLPGWGAKSAATALDRYERIEKIPADAGEWDVDVRGAQKLAATLSADRDLALLFRDLATLRTDAPVGAMTIGVGAGRQGVRRVGRPPGRRWDGEARPPVGDRRGG